MVNEKLTQPVGLQEYFLERVQEAIAYQKLSLSSEAEFYLVHILAHFAKAENLFQTGDDGRTEYRALALKLFDSINSAQNSEKFSHLKSLGDTALYHAGVFYDNLYNKVVDVDYYIQMGGSAYLSLANLSTSSASTAKSLSDLFAELSEHFAQLVEVLKISCEHNVTPSDNDILKLIDRYKKTGSLKAKKILKEHGISIETLVSEKTVQ